MSTSTIGNVVNEFMWGEKNVAWNLVLAVTWLLLAMWFYRQQNLPWAMLAAFGFGLRGERAYQLSGGGRHDADE